MGKLCSTGPSSPSASSWWALPGCALLTMMQKDPVLELELIHCRHWPSAKSRDKERYCTYSEPMERCKCREGGELESTQSTAQRVKSRLYCLDFKVFHCLVSLQPSNPSLSLWTIHLGHMSSWTLGILQKPNKTGQFQAANYIPTAGQT